MRTVCLNTSSRSAARIAAAVAAAVALGAVAAPAANADPLARFTVPDGTPTYALPTVTAGHHLVAWSAPTANGRWGLRLASRGVDVGINADTQRWPIDASIGRGNGTTQLLWSQCADKKAVTRAQATGCDLVRLSKLGPGGRPISVGKANTKSGSEYAPSRAGDTLVFARRKAGDTFSSLVARDLPSGKETALPGGTGGKCDASCAAAGGIAGGPLSTSLDGQRYATLWEFNGGPRSIGITVNDEILRGTLHGKKAIQIDQTGLVSGTCSEILYGSVQSLGVVTQAVRRGYSCDNATPAPVDGEYVERADAGGDLTRYADPQGRRIIAAAADGKTLWVIREARAFPFDNATPRPARCSAAVGGCELEAVENPTFEPVAGSR